jgi:hypothetical protein
MDMAAPIAGHGPPILVATNPVGSGGLPPLASHRRGAGRRPDTGRPSGGAAFGRLTDNAAGPSSVSAIQDWLTNNDERLVDIAHRSDIVPGVVHLAAVLVLAGFTDTAIYDQMEVLNVRLRDGHDPLAGLLDALTEIRELAAAQMDVGVGGPLESD